MRNLTLAVLLSLIGLSSPTYAQDKVVTEMIDRLGIRESPVASREMAGWSRPSKVTILKFGDAKAGEPGSLEWMREISDGVKIEMLSLDEMGAGYERIVDTDVIIGWCVTGLIKAGTSLDYIHILSAGIDRCMTIPGIGESGLIASNSAKAASETIAETSIALMLALTRNLHFYLSAQRDRQWKRGDSEIPSAISVRGKTMLVLGLGGIGSQVAKIAHDLGMRVIGTRNSSREGPDYVDYVGLSDEMFELAGQADVVVNALPLTESTRGIVNSDFFAKMKPTAYYVSVGRGATTDTDALTKALNSGKLMGAGLDVTDPEPLPADHVLWSLPNVIITPHVASRSDLSRSNTLLLARENLRRYIQGDKLLNLVDLKRGY